MQINTTAINNNSNNYNQETECATVIIVFVTDVVREISIFFNLVTCGSRPSTTRIEGGTIAPVNSWPWQVMVTDEYGNDFCGGSLVDIYWVVTTASCVVRKNPSSVRIR